MQAQQPKEHCSKTAEPCDPVLNLKRFALVVAGDEARANQLMTLLETQIDLPQPGDIAAGTLQFLQFRRLYELWRSLERGKPAPTGLFAPDNANEAIRKGLDPQIAAVLGSLPSQHRALLLLVYGENYSYAAAAQLLGISIEQLMNALARARLKFADQAAHLPRQDELPGAGPAQAVRAAGRKAREVVDDAA